MFKLTFGIKARQELSENSSWGADKYPAQLTWKFVLYKGILSSDCSKITNFLWRFVENLKLLSYSMEISGEMEALKIIFWGAEGLSKQFW